MRPRVTHCPLQRHKNLAMTVDNLNGGVGRRVWNYATRVLPAASVLLVVTILIFSFVLSPYGKVREGAFDGSATPWQLALSFYTVLLHGMSILFPARVCWAMGNVTANMRAIAARENKFVPQKVVRGENEKNATEYPAPLFVIILPAYKEDLATLEETIRVLASHPQAHQCYHVRFPPNRRGVKLRKLRQEYDPALTFVALSCDGGKGGQVCLESCSVGEYLQDCLLPHELYRSPTRYPW